MSEPRSIDVLQLTASDLGGSTTVMRDLRRGKLDACVVRGLYSEAELQPLLERLGEAQIREELVSRDHADPERTQIGVLGIPVSPSDLYPGGPALEPYLGAAPGFEERCRALMAPSEPFSTRLERTLSTLYGGAEVERFTTTDGRRYGACTLRYIPTGCGLPPHCEQPYAGIEVYAPVRERCDLAGKLGFFMCVQRAEGGGELNLYPQSWDPQRRLFADLPLEPVTDFSPHAVELDAGDLVVLRSGTTYHQVTRVTGARARWTIGGFGAFEREHERFFYWA